MAWSVWYKKTISNASHFKFVSFFPWQHKSFTDPLMGSMNISWQTLVCLAITEEYLVWVKSRSHLMHKYTEILCKAASSCITNSTPSWEVFYMNSSVNSHMLWMKLCGEKVQKTNINCHNLFSQQAFDVSLQLLQLFPAGHDVAGNVEGRAAQRLTQPLIFLTQLLQLLHTFMLFPVKVLQLRPQLLLPLHHGQVLIHLQKDPHNSWT